MTPGYAWLALRSPRSPGANGVSPRCGLLALWLPWSLWGNDVSPRYAWLALRPPRSPGANDVSPRCGLLALWLPCLLYDYVLSYTLPHESVAKSRRINDVLWGEHRNIVGILAVARLNSGTGMVYLLVVYQAVPTSLQSS